MGDSTKIEWTDATWNPVVGCRRVSEGCRNCYAETVAAGNVRRLRGVVAKTGSAKAKATLKAYEQAVRMDADGEPRPLWSGRAIVRPEMLDVPLRWGKPRRIFVNSMSDLFHEDVPFDFIAAVFGVMAAAPQHTFQVLTKRPERMREWFRWVESGERRANGKSDPSLECAWRLLAQESEHHDDGMGGPIHTKYGPDPDAAWPLPNVHLGVSVEDQATADERIPLLLQCPAAVRWVSMEPLIGPVDLERVNVGGNQWLRALSGALEWDGGREGVNIDPLDWIVVGGESGANARPMHPDWVRDIRDQCAAADVPFFFKQWGEWRECIPPGEWHGEDPSRHTLTQAHGAWFARLGKHRAGRLLDGVEHNDGPLDAAGGDR